MSEQSKRRLRLAAREFFDVEDIGCRDKSCIYGHPGGQATNSSCRCIKTTDAGELRGTVRQLAALARYLAEELTLAEGTNEGEP